MTSMNKKRKCRNTLYTNGSEKRSLSRSKRSGMYHKQNRVANKKMCDEVIEDDHDPRTSQ